MAVLNGERMHDTMERLLPGARSAALLWQGAAVLGGAALGATFLSRTKFVTLENPDTLLVRNCENIVRTRGRGDL